MTLAIIFLILGWLGIVTGAAIIGANEDSVGLITVACGIVLLILGVLHLHNIRNWAHYAAYKDLTRQHWKITSNDIHIKSKNVDVASCVTLKLKKLNGRYYVVRKRTELGGGYQVVPSSAQAKFMAACKAING